MQVLCWYVCRHRPDVYAGWLQRTWMPTCHVLDIDAATLPSLSSSWLPGLSERGSSLLHETLATRVPPDSLGSHHAAA
jgi:hypothetical protein